uniref:Reverse transcriptase domain-containing protein n=1 Tax=Cannabis sativa TaxID=3483 RepID=A0A803QDA2_CANSA
MAEAIQDYFEHIFHSQIVDEDALQATLSCIPATITPDMNINLIKPFTPSEVNDALFSMGSDKSPGIDGMSAMFYQRHWDIVGDSVCSAVLNVLNHGVDPSPLNSTIITLIPKKKKPIFVKDYRPIALLAFELIHGIKIRMTGRKGIAAMKLDMSKGFDRVEWVFVKGVMERMGFCSQWVTLIMTCLTTNHFTFLLNGETTSSLTPTRGLRQGCPLSPYLFLLCFEGFSRLLQHEEMLGNLHGYKLTRRAGPISHLLFADDSLLFCYANESSCLSIKRVLDIYHRASGQALNADKLIMSFSPNTTTAVQVFFHKTLSMPIMECHEKYLGLLAYSGRDKQQMFTDVKEKVWRLMNTWNEKIFLAEGKEILLKAIVQSIPMYAMSCFRLLLTLNNLIHLAPLQIKLGGNLFGRYSYRRKSRFLLGESSIMPSPWQLPLSNKKSSLMLLAQFVDRRGNLLDIFFSAVPMLKLYGVLHNTLLTGIKQFQCIKVLHGEKAKSATSLAAFSLQYLDHYRAAQVKYQPTAIIS